VAAYFDGVADEYDQVLPFFACFARQVAEVITIPPHAQVLDLGAGRGALSAELAGRVARIVAVDAAPRMVELLAHDLPAVEARVMTRPGWTLPMQLSILWSQVSWCISSPTHSE
jgi:16S rRNA A1518/A1519 N6-dimethyltransferase RsmA/KsgA/DIM1 with predicted DNA glycosylase/AP lyase activity